MKYIIPLLFLALLQTPSFADPAVHMANGIKIGAVTSDSAIVWTRLTQHPDRNRSGIEFLVRQELRRPQGPTDGLSQLPAGKSLEDMEGSAPGIAGQVRLTYWVSSDATQKKTTDWTAVSDDKDFTHQFQLDELEPNAQYTLLVQGRSQGATAASVNFEGAFRTAPTKEQAEEITFAVVGGGDYPRRDDAENGHKIFKTILEQIRPDFYVHTGDIEYYDKAQPYAVSQTLARFKWNRLTAMPYWRNMHSQVGSYFIKDDHDTLMNDSWPGQRYGNLTWQQGLGLFREQFPIGEKSYRTVRWGKDLQIWIVEGRDFRSANNMQDGPDKTIWGQEQKQWFFETVQQSDATFRILISPTPVVGPDRSGKNDNHANAGFTHEGDEIRQFIGSQKNMFVICGDRHWQYASVDPETKVREFSCGASTDKHANGWNSRNLRPEHEYLKVKGGFLSVTVDPGAPDNGAPQITFRFHAVNGEVYHEYKTGELD